MSKKIALVTGGKGGIGTEICERLHSDGYQVISTYIHNAERLSAWSVQHEHINMVQCDVSDYQACQKMAKEVLDTWGVPEVIVNNAGITHDTTFKRMSHQQWSEVIRTNLDGAFNVTHPFFAQMVERGSGSIVNISSINGQKGQFGQVNYSAAKAGLHGFTMALAQEAARSGVTVNTVSPGYTATPMVTAIRQDVLDKIIAQIPVQRLAQPEEIAAAVAYLCSDAAKFITGINLPVNGGQFMSF